MLISRTIDEAQERLILARSSFLRVRSFGILRNKNIFRNIFRSIFRLFCSWEQNSRNGNPGIPE